MKLLATIIAVLMLTALTKSASAGNYKYWFTRDGVEVYEKWSCDDCSDIHLNIKIVNTNSYRVTVSWDRLVWKEGGADGSIVGRGDAYQDDYTAGQIKYGDYMGLFFYPPNGYSPSNLDFELKNFEVTQ